MFFPSCKHISTCLHTIYAAGHLWDTAVRLVFFILCQHTYIHSTFTYIQCSLLTHIQSFQHTVFAVDLPLEHSCLLGTLVSLRTIHTLTGVVVVFFAIPRARSRCFQLYVCMQVCMYVCIYIYIYITFLIRAKTNEGRQLTIPCSFMFPDMNAHICIQRYIPAKTQGNQPYLVHFWIQCPNEFSRPPTLPAYVCIYAYVCKYVCICVCTFVCACMPMISGAFEIKCTIITIDLLRLHAFIQTCAHAHEGTWYQKPVLTLPCRYSSALHKYTHVCLHTNKYASTCMWKNTGVNHVSWHVPDADTHMFT